MPTQTLKPSKSRKEQKTNGSTPSRSRSVEDLPPALEEHSTISHANPANGLPSEEEIARRAYALAEERQRTGQTGDALGDWLRAEQELLAETSQF